MSPAVTAGIDITGAIKFDVCFDEVVVLGVTVLDNLCINQILGLLSPTATAADSSSCRAVAQNTDGEKLECTSCTICPEGGYKFDCTNVDPLVVSSNCTGYYPNSFGDVSSPQKVGVPVLDSA